MSDIPVEDRLAIEELVSEYAFRCDTRQYERCVDLFLEDAVFDETVLGLPLCGGRPMIREAFVEGSQHMGTAFGFHLFGNHRVTAFHGDTARGTCHLLFEARARAGETRVLGYFEDDYKKVDGKWYFSRRKLLEIAPTATFESSAARHQA